MRLTNSFLNYPGRWLISFYLFAVVLSGFAFGLGFFEIDPIAERDFMIWDDKAVVDSDK
jgi:hypothetical protein